VLTGRASERVTAAGHSALSTFGLLKGDSPSVVRGYIEQLLGAGFLSRVGDPYPVLRLTPAGAALLKGEGECPLYREAQPAAKSRGRGRGVDARPGAASALFDALRDVRLQLARARGVPPYVIFHDTTLRELAERRPVTMAELHEVYGIGAKKAADFGALFLEAIRRSQPDRPSGPPQR
jgi:ATP-dependent DNA helicase RecQ